MRSGPDRADAARCGGWWCGRCAPRRRCATRTGWPAAGRSSPTGPRAGSATCTSRTWWPPGWAQLHRDLRLETARDGLILDVRGNGGGHTSQLVVEKLARKVIGWDAARHRQPTTYPRDAPRGPVVALADELSGSDGDIVTAAIKRLGIGPVVGHAHLGRRDRHRQPLQPGRRHRGHPAALRLLVRRLRLGRGEPRRRPGRRGGDRARRTGRPAATRSWSARSTWPWTRWPSAPRPGPRTRRPARPGSARSCHRVREPSRAAGAQRW